MGLSIYAGGGDIYRRSSPSGMTRFTFKTTPGSTAPGQATAHPEVASPLAYLREPRRVVPPGLPANLQWLFPPNAGPHIRNRPPRVPRSPPPAPNRPPP